MTTYFAKSAQDVEKRLANRVNQHWLLHHHEGDLSAPYEVARGSRFRANLFDEERPVDIVARGGGGGAYHEVCRIQVGPAEVTKPVSPDFMFELVDDPELAKRMRSAVGIVPIDKFYELEVVVDGIRISFDQFPMGGSRPNVLFVLDGCGREAPRTERRRFDQVEAPEFVSEKPSN